ncbi:MAG: MraY family glycosyltransferase [Anaerovoracaceae bacterium]
MKIIVLCGLIYLIAFVVTVIFVPLSIKLAHKVNAIDIPKDNRRVHTKATPRIGGVAIFIGVSVALLFCIFAGLFSPGGIIKETGIATFSFGTHTLSDERIHSIVGVLIGSVVIFAVGLYDDIKDMDPKVKLAGQIIAASIVYAFGARIQFISIMFNSDVTYFGSIISYIVTVLWIVAITNTINLVDGLDGLASGVVAIASLCIAYVGYIFGYYIGALPMVALAGGCLGFLLFNFYPAKTFMGDCGSQYLGFMIASFSMLGTVKSATIVAVLIPSLALSLPILDTFFAIVRRTINRRPVMEADKEHLHHRLLRTGMGQRRTVLCMYGICGIMGTAAVLFSRELYVETIGLLGVAFMYIYVVLTDPNRKVPHVRKPKDEEENK